MKFRKEGHRYYSSIPWGTNKTRAVEGGLVEKKLSSTSISSHENERQLYRRLGRWLCPGSSWAASCRLVLVCASAVSRNREIQNKNDSTTFLDKNRWGSSLHHSGDCFCLFVVIQFIVDVRLYLSVNIWTHQPESQRRRKPSFCGACLSFSSREGVSRPFHSSTVMSNICVPTT